MPPKSTPRMTQQLAALSSTYAVTLTLPWMLAHGVGASKLRVVDEIRARSGGYSHKVAVRTAEVTPRRPGSWSLSSARNTNVATPENFSPGAGVMWMQVGLAPGAEGGTVGDALASIQAFAISDADVIASQRIQIQPDLNASSTAYYLLGKPIAAVGLSEFMYAIILTGVSGTTTMQPAVRYFDVEDDATGSFTDLGSTYSPSANDFKNWGALSLTPGTVGFAQAALKVTAASRATLDIIVSAKY